MKKLITVINTTLPFGRALNAAAHSVLGMGHRIPDGYMPDIFVFMANSEQIRAFRQKAYSIWQSNVNSILYADFTNTMIYSTAEEQLFRTSNTVENDLIYYAVSICAEDNILEILAEMLDDYTAVPNYEVLNYCLEQARFDFLPNIVLPDNNDPRYSVSDNNKVVMAFNKKQDTNLAINAMIMAVIEIGRKAELRALYLLMYVDASNHMHPNISHHAIPIVTAKNQNKLDTIAEMVSCDNNLTSTVMRDQNSIVNVVAVFGASELVDVHTKQCSLWTREMVQASFQREY